jgi:putative tricarboxylic transport membrane protein
MRKLNIATAILLLLLAAYVYLEAGTFPAATDTLGPEFFPKLVAGLLAAFSVGILLFAVLGKREEIVPDLPSKPLVVIMAAMVIYVALLPHAGFLTTTPVFLTIAGIVIADSVSYWWKKVVISSVVTTGALYYLFAVLLNVPLP